MAEAGKRLHVHHLITMLELGGAQQNTLYCAANHDRKAYRVSLGAGPGGILDSEARRIRGVRLRFFPNLVRPVSPFRDLAFLFEYVRYLRAEKVDILHTHSSKAGILGRLAAAIAGTPVVVHTVHGWGFHDYQPWPARILYVALERMMAPHTDLLIAVSRENVDRGLRNGIGVPSQYRVIRSGIRRGEFARPRRSRSAVRRALGIPAGARVVGTVGNFKPQKAPLDFIRMAAMVSRKVSGARFVMVGDGPLLGESRSVAASLGIKDRVVFTGWRRDVPDLLHAFDVFALSSLFEGLPRSVLQAHSAGLPVVATAAGGTAEAVRHGISGYVVAPRDVAGLAEGVASLLGKPSMARRMGEAGRRLIGTEFDITRMLDEIETAYRALAKRKGLA